MEFPIPNFYFMGVQFLHLLALSIWVGGIVVLSAVVTPALYKRIPSKHLASALISDISRKFDRAALFCASALVVTALIKFLQWENLTPWNLIRYMAISIMCAVCLYSCFPIFPEFRKWIPLSTPENGHANPLKSTSPRLMLVNLICGVTALLMA